VQAELRKLINSKKHGEKFSAKEKALIWDVIHAKEGGAIVKALSTLGISSTPSLRDIVPIATIAAGGFGGGIWGAAAGPAVGWLAGRVKESRALSASDALSGRFRGSEEVVSSYLKNTPKRKQDKRELEDKLIHGEMTAGESRQVIDLWSISDLIAGKAGDFTARVATSALALEILGTEEEEETTELWRR